MARLLNINLADPFMKALKAVNSKTNSGTSLTKEDLEKQRSSMERASILATPVTGVSYESIDVNGISCEWSRPDFPHNTSVVILYAHGGGYTTGGLLYARILAAKLALNAGLEVLSFDYRLAPENKYPAALEDAEAVYDYLLHIGYGAKNVILAGDSAGGNLVLCLTQKLVAEARKSPKALILFSPWTDMSAKNESYVEQKEKDPILTYEYIIAVRDAYIGKDADASDAKYSPINGSFEGFPPVLIQVGKNEVLQDDSNLLAKKINKAGGSAVLKLYKDGWHVFQQMPTPGAARAMQEVGEYVRSLIYE